MVRKSTKKALSAGERLNEILTYFNVAPSDFARRVGWSPQGIRDILNGKIRTISVRLRIYICNEFTDVNPRWLANGEGEMLVKTSPKVVQIAQDSHDFTQRVNTSPRACDTCTLLRDAHEQIKRLLDIIERLQT